MSDAGAHFLVGINCIGPSNNLVCIQVSCETSGVGIDEDHNHSRVSMTRIEVPTKQIHASLSVSLMEHSCLEQRQALHWNVSQKIAFAKPACGARVGGSLLHIQHRHIDVKYLHVKMVDAKFNNVSHQPSASQGPSSAIVTVTHPPCEDLLPEIRAGPQLRVIPLYTPGHAESVCKGRSACKVTRCIASEIFGPNMMGFADVAELASIIRPGEVDLKRIFVTKVVVSRVWNGGRHCRFDIYLLQSM
ncbi:hypothetical protein KEM54_004613 [Ascosphaera aggregata]|nr:hypothetical protein KEM54_004613 [Ascosphaera aggregata]